MTERGRIHIDGKNATAAAAELVRWAGACRAADGCDLLTLAAAMVTTGANIGVGQDDDEDYRKAWATWLRGLADDIEHGHEIQIGNA